MMNLKRTLESLHAEGFSYLHAPIADNPPLDRKSYSLNKVAGAAGKDLYFEIRAFVPHKLQGVSASTEVLKIRSRLKQTAERDPATSVLPSCTVVTASVKVGSDDVPLNILPILDQLEAANEINARMNQRKRLHDAVLKYEPEEE